MSLVKVEEKIVCTGDTNMARKRSVYAAARYIKGPG
jgi:hypothetical protein